MKKLVYTLTLLCVLCDVYAAVPVGPKPAHKHPTDDVYLDDGTLKLFNNEPVKDDALNSCSWAVYLPKDAGDLAGVDYPHKICHGSNYEGWYTYLVYDVVNGVFITANTDPLIYDATAESALLTEANYKSNSDFIVTKLYFIETGLSTDVYLNGPNTPTVDEFGSYVPRWNQSPRYRLGPVVAESDDQDGDGIRDTYVFGSPPSEPGHRANEAAYEIRIQDLPNSFWMPEFECSQGLFTALCSRMTLNGPGGVTELEKNNAHSGGAFVDYITEYTDVDLSRYRAMNFISWDDINDTTDGFMKELNDALKAAVPSMTTSVRLPNELEWEYACRMGRSTAFNTGYSISSAGVWNTDAVTYNLSTFTVEEDETWKRSGVITGADNAVIDPAGQTDFGMKITMELEIGGQATIGSQANFDGRYRRWYTPVCTYQYDSAKQAYVQHFTNDLSIGRGQVSTLDPSVGGEVEIDGVTEKSERIFFNFMHFRKSITGLHMPVDARGRWQSSIVEVNNNAANLLSGDDVDNISGAAQYRTDASTRPIERFVMLNESLIPSSDTPSNPYLSTLATSPLLRPSNPQTATALVYYKEAEYDEGGIFLNTTGPMSSANKSEFINTIMDRPLSSSDLNLSADFDQTSMNELIEIVNQEVRRGLQAQWSATGGWGGTGSPLTSWPDLNGRSLLSEVADASFTPDNYAYMDGNVWSVMYFVGRPGTYTGNHQNDPSSPPNATGDQRGGGWWEAFDFDHTGPLAQGDGFYLRHDYPETGNTTSKEYHDMDALITDNGLNVVVEKAPSLWKLSDMHGNLAEFCIPGDYTDPMYRWDGTKTYADIETDQAGGADDTVSATVPVRGGNWRSNADGIRSARRDAIRTDKRYSTCGFRFIIPADNQRYAADDVATYTTAAPRPTP